MSERYDVAIIGSGPAGLSAAINLQIRKKNFIIFGNNFLSNKLVKAPEIKNYLGLYNLTGNEIKDKFLEHITAMDIQIREEKVTSVYAMGDYYAVMANNNTYEAKSIIVATGVEYSSSLENEEKFLGRGVSYCATCDAPLYKEKNITIVGYSKQWEEEVEFLSEVASTISYIPMYKEVGSFKDNVKIINDKPVSIIGDKKATGLKLANGEITCDGIFILKDSMSPAQLVPGLETEDDNIKVDRNMQTNLKGCFAAGDCSGKPYQYIKAAGEGQIAAASVIDFLNKNK